MKLCMFNDCKMGDHKYSIRCCDCHEKDCPERCINEFCDSCYWETEEKDESSQISDFEERDDKRRVKEKV